MNRSYWLLLAALLPGLAFANSHSDNKGPKGRPEDRATPSPRASELIPERLSDAQPAANDPQLEAIELEGPGIPGFSIVVLRPAAPAQQHSCCHNRTKTGAAEDGSAQREGQGALVQAGAALTGALRGAQTGSPAAPVYDGADEPNASAALAFEAQHRGELDPNGLHPLAMMFGGAAYPNSRPVPFEETRHIHALSFDKNPIFRIPEIVADFRKHRTPDEKGIMVVLKTEFCHTNPFRPCAVTTAALDHHSPRELAGFRMYGAWIKFESAARPDVFDEETAGRMQVASYNRASEQAMRKRFPKQFAWYDWSDAIEKYYRFDQGPGSNMFFINPNVDLDELARNPVKDIDDAVARGIVIRTDANETGYLHRPGIENLVHPMRGIIEKVQKTFGTYEPPKPGRLLSRLLPKRK